MAGYIGMERYSGIHSEEGLDMCVSNCQESRSRDLINIRIANSEPIEIRVGIEANLKIWHLPKKLLTNNSTFFAAALDGGFAEQHSKTVTLPEVATDDFKAWIRWLYLGELLPKAFGPPDLESEKELVRLWSLGDMLGCPMFQDASLAALVLDMNMDAHGMRPEFLSFIWETCAHGSKLREFVVDQFTNDVRMGRFEGDPESQEAYTQFAEDNEDFAREYIAASIRNGGREWSPQTLRETYAPSLYEHITSP